MVYTGMSVQLGKLYGVVAKVQIPPNTKLQQHQGLQDFWFTVYLEHVPCMLL